MNDHILWACAFVTVGLAVVYELYYAWASRTRPATLARTANALLREEWFKTVTSTPGTEVLAVQTLRNSLMSATMTASTAVLGLMGTVSLAAPSLHASLGEIDSVSLSALPHVSPRLAIELMLLAMLFTSLIASAMAVRYYTHSSFVTAMPVGSAAARQWQHAGISYIRKAGIYYSWALRQLIMVGPLVAFILHPLAGPFASVLLLFAMRRFDRVQSADA